VSRPTHLLTPPETSVAADVLCSMLAFQSRGTRPLGPSPERKDLAPLVGPGPLAELLAGGRPILVRSAAEGYEFADFETG
jgi:hypothetical protein